MVVLMRCTFVCVEKTLIIHGIEVELRLEMSDKWNK